MKIKKIDDKPMIIHNKTNTKIHSHTPKKTSIKGGNILSVDRGPKIKTILEKFKARMGDSVYMKQKGKRIYRKSTVHNASNIREHGIANFRRNIKESGQAVKLKQTSFHMVGRTGVKAVTDQMDGGKEVQQATYLACEVTRPVTGIASRGAEFIKKNDIVADNGKIKRVEVGKKLTKKSSTRFAKKITNKVVNKTAKGTVKIAARTATTAKTLAVGIAAQPKVGKAIGIAAGYMTGVATETKDTHITNRKRKIMFFLDKLKAQENQQDSIVKLMKDLITRRALLWIKTVAPIIGLVLLLLVLVVAMITIPVIAVVAVIYNSPFALFLPPLEAGDTVQTVASAYVAEFNRDVKTLGNDHTGYDKGQIVYVDYEGIDATPSNYYDILAVYMVKYGVGDTATIMNDTSKAWLKSVVDDMCSYTTSTGSETVANEDGTTSTMTTTYLYVNVTLKSYRDMISEYGFNSDEVEMLEEIMSPEYLFMLGWSDGGGGGDPGVCSLTETEINSILTGITNSTQKAVCSFVLHRVGYPYSQELRDNGDYYDCSSLAYYAWRSAGVNISNGGATTASAEGQKLDEAGQTVSFDEMQSGDLIFYSYTNNGRYKNISHVAIYVGGGKVVEARSEKYGVVYRDVPNIESIVFIGRP